MMKKYFLFLKFLILTLAFLPFSSCSNNEDSTPEQGVVFDSVILNLSGLNIELEDTSFSVEDYNFKAFRAVSYTPDTSGILLAFPLDGIPSYVELNLSNVKGLSKITSEVSDYGGSTKVSIWKAGQLIEEIDAMGESTEIDLVGKQIDALRFSSFEGDVRMITLE